mmetsp:Transcript_9606/g.13299  ORF Transcript_9606/g.13299 Transcript_9606/m.13299 type:complete len:138 (+) Transcript_9606:87-500(+)
MEESLNGDVKLEFDEHEEEDKKTDLSQVGFSVDVLNDCPHTSRIGSKLEEGLIIDLQKMCDVCGELGENMICAVCGIVCCGRYVNRHMIQHARESGHEIVAAFSDLSFWCYKCDTYLSPSNPKLQCILRPLTIAKFS